MKNATSPDRLHGMLMAHSALMFSLIRTMSPTQLELLKQAHSEESQALMAHLLNSGASEPLVEAADVQLQSQASYLDSFQP